MNKVKLFLDYNNLFFDLDKAYDDWENDDETLVEMAVSISGFGFGKRHFANMNIVSGMPFEEYIGKAVKMCEYL